MRLYGGNTYADSSSSKASEQDTWHCCQVQILDAHAAQAGTYIELSRMLQKQQS